MAEYGLRRMAQHNRLDLTVSSAGLRALIGRGADNNAIEVMLDNGIDLSSHRARQLNDVLIRESDLILVMENWQRKEVERLYPFTKGRIYMLDSWNGTEIDDPYQLPKIKFVEAYEQINALCAKWCEQLR